jgi:hypothetical protein
MLCGSRFLCFPFRQNGIQLNSAEHYSGETDHSSDGIPFRYPVPIAPEFTSAPIFRWVAGTGTLLEEANAIAMIIGNG